MSRTTVRRRGAVAATVVMLLLFGGHARAGARRPAGGRTYVVQAGDTIWDIAQRKVGPRADARPLVDRLIRLNHLHDATIFVGERLSVPSDPAHGR
jgi:Tfp pilus assembly protein FimV